MSRKELKVYNELIEMDENLEDINIGIYIIWIDWFTLKYRSSLYQATWKR